MTLIKALHFRYLFDPIKTAFLNYGSPTRSLHNFIHFSSQKKPIPYFIYYNITMYSISVSGNRALAL